MTPIERYHEALKSGLYEKDILQEKAIKHLQNIYDQLAKQITPWQRFIATFKRRPPIIKGLYLWGSVGIGKTWLMDLFYNSLRTEKKCRIHFHKFMREVHQNLKELQGKSDPLKILAKQFAKQFRVLCFDEFFVNDIADAMLLAELFKALFAENIILIATSNVAPKDLYKNGLQRQRFLPAIKLIEQHTDILFLLATTDYRLRILAKDEVYFYPLTTENDLSLLFKFHQLTSNNSLDSNMNINEREIQTVRYGSVVAWFRFDDLCSSPRSQMDYIELAKLFHTLFLSDVPKILKSQDNKIRYLINLIDILYDANVKLVISAEVNLDELYTEGRLLFEFQRTKSRLTEMQSLEYLQKPHRG